MAEKTRDARQVTFKVSRQELTSVIASKAIELGMIDFQPDMMEIFDQGENIFELTFIKNTTVTP